MHVVSELDPRTGALLARNRYNSDFSERLAFMDVQDDEQQKLVSLG